MSIKSTILSDLVTKIKSNAGLIDRDTDLYNVLETALNNYYPTVINETQATTNTITARNSVNTNLQYEVDIYKQGRTVFINGFVKNNSSSAVNDSFFQIVGSEYLPKPVAYSGAKYICTTNESTSGLNLATLDGNRIKGVVPANGTIIFSLNYPTLN
jgi:hypothetical protein